MSSSNSSLRARDRRRTSTIEVSRPAHRRQRLDGKALAENGGVLHQRRGPSDPERRDGPRSARGATAVRRTVRLKSTRRYRSPSRTRRPSSSSIRTVSTAYSGTPSDRSTICATAPGGSPGTMPRSMSAMSAVRDRFELQDDRSSADDAPHRPALRQLRAREGDHQDGPGAAPREHRLDEVQQALVGPVEILEQQHRRTVVGDVFEECSPRGEQLLALADGSVRPCRAGPQAAARSSAGRSHRGRTGPRLRRASVALWRRPPTRRSRRGCEPSRRAPSRRSLRRTPGSDRSASTRPP